MVRSDLREKISAYFERIGGLVLELTSFLAAKRSGSHNPTIKDTDSKSGIEPLFRSMFAERLSETIKWVGIVLVLVLAIDYFFLSIPEQVYGLVLDLSGAVIVARGLFRGAEEIRASSSGVTITGYSSTLIDRSTENEGLASPRAIEVGSTVDGIIGSSLLCIGFLVQIWAVTF